MAIVETRRLEINWFSDDQMVGLITGLDPEYVGDVTIRKIEWNIYLGESESGKLIETYSGTIKNGALTTSYTFSNLTPSTTYCITAIISNISGVDGEIKYIGRQSTADSGGGEFGQVPIIHDFTVRQTEIGERKIYYKVHVSNLLSSSSWVLVQIYFNGILIYEKEWDNQSDGEVNTDRTVATDMDGNALDFGNYEVRLEAVNLKNTPQIMFASVTLIKEKPLCTLNCKFYDESYSFDDGRVTGTIKDYPHILATDFNQFRADINTVRDKAGLNAYGFDDDVIANTKMNMSLFKALFDSICSIYYDKGWQWLAKYPSSPTEGQQITKGFIEGIEEALQNARDILYNT